MEEIISKSKFFKVVTGFSVDFFLQCLTSISLYWWFYLVTVYSFFQAEKAKDKEENEQLIEQLDQEFTSLVHSEALLSLTQPNKMHALRALVNNPSSNNEAKKNETSSVQTKAPTQLVYFLFP